MRDNAVFNLRVLRRRYDLVFNQRLLRHCNGPPYLQRSTMQGISSCCGSPPTKASTCCINRLKTSPELPALLTGTKLGLQASLHKASGVLTLFPPRRYPLGQWAGQGTKALPARRQSRMCELLSILVEFAKTSVSKLVQPFTNRLKRRINQRGAA